MEESFSISYYDRILPEHFEFSPRQYRYKFFLITNGEFAGKWVMYEFIDGSMSLAVSEVNEKDPFKEDPEYDEVEMHKQFCCVCSLIEGEG